MEWLLYINKIIKVVFVRGIELGLGLVRVMIPYNISYIIIDTYHGNS